MPNEAGWDFVSPGFHEVEADAGPTVRTYIPELKAWIDKPLRGEPFEAAHVEACDHHLAHVDDETPWWMGEPPTSEQRERRRAELESEKAAVIAELARLGEDVVGLMPKAKQTTKRK